MRQEDAVRQEELRVRPADAAAPWKDAEERRWEKAERSALAEAAPESSPCVRPAEAAERLEVGSALWPCLRSPQERSAHGLWQHQRA